MTKKSANLTPPDASPQRPQIDAKDTDRQLPKYFSNSFNRYSDFQHFAKGGAAELRSCLDNNLGRTVLMKTLHPHLANHEYLRARFLREARVTAQLQHPNTATVYEIGHDVEGRLYFTMKKIDGETLHEVIQRQPTDPNNQATGELLTLDRLLSVLLQVCNALAYAHAHGVVHRDVKPENILLGEYGEVVLLDWGVAKVWALDEEEETMSVLHEDLTVVGQRPGTPLYMSPEQVRGGAEIDARTDVYSIGVVLYEALTLKEPLRGKRVNETFEMIAKTMPVPPRERAPQRNIPHTLSNACMKALAKDPQDRYQTMQEMIEVLRNFRSQALQTSEEE